MLFGSSPIARSITVICFITEKTHLFISDAVLYICQKELIERIGPGTNTKHNSLGEALGQSHTSGAPRRLVFGMQPCFNPKKWVTVDF